MLITTKPKPQLKLIVMSLTIMQLVVALNTTLWGNQNCYKSS